ncbi:phenylalanine--tRNA ligase subunit beta [Poriferisphaera sp. WC338]|uniref:phenylalanine--tRNA ligase subunit beta n=1 Tax=Poriferisphaera sp. WC338 TaxID=3425129 RepID=UPI003D817825
MKISLEWFNAYLDRSATEEEVAGVMTDVGFPEDGTDHLDGGDVMMDLEVTSNRSDCLSVVGLARELCAATGRELARPEFGLDESSKLASAGELTSVLIEAEDLCPVYTARVIKGVKVGPSPDWMVKRLEAVGLRSVNNVVDVTNYVLLEMGQPLHAFDMGLLKEGRIVVRRAEVNEKFTAIDGSNHELDHNMLVIADAEKAVAIAGVMGGLHSEVGNETVDVLLESARFDPLSVRRTSRKLKLGSDSSFRFERGVDPRGVEAASRRAASLIVELAGGEIAEGVVRVGENEPSDHGQVTMRVARANQLLGTDLSAEVMAGYLSKLGLEPEIDGEKIICTVPTFRLDLKREVDLIEEVARHFGLENIAISEKIHLEVKPTQEKIKAGKKLAEALIAHGFHETITYSFVTAKQGKGFLQDGQSGLMLNEDMRKADGMLRPSALPSLLACRKLNQDLGNSGVKLFETCSVWHQAENEIIETVKLTLLADAIDQDGAMRDLRGTIEEAVETLGGVAAREAIMIEATEGNLWEVAAAIKIGEKEVGVMGLLHQKVSSDGFDLQMKVVGAELDLHALKALYPPIHETRDLPRVPAIERDLSVVVEEDVRWSQIEGVVVDEKPELLEQVEFIEVYRGKQIGKGKKSVSFRLLFRDPVQTLRHEQVDPQMKKVMDALGAKLNAEVRGA